MNQRTISATVTGSPGNAALRAFAHLLRLRESARAAPTLVNFHAPSETDTPPAARIAAHDHPRRLLRPQ
jgi:hypothetical protein